MPAISFCIPFYSGKVYLARAVESVRNQTVADWELIIVDDCGPDQEIELLLNNYNDFRISYTRNESNLGLARNWNRCLEMASSQLVTLLHADDELMPEYAFLMCELHKRQPHAAAYFCRATIIDESNGSVFSFPDFIKTLLMPSQDEAIILRGEAAMTSLLRGNYIFCPTLCFNMGRIGNRRFSINWKMVLDLDFVTELLFGGETIIGLPNKAYAYRRHSQNQTAKLTSSMVRFDEEIKIYKDIEKKAEYRGWKESAQVASGLKMIKMHIAYLICKDLVTFQWRGIPLRLRYLRQHNLIF